jgi:hypothetical protein
MAGENVLASEHYPDYFQVFSHSIDHNLIPNSTNRMLVMYVEPRAGNGSGIVIDSITYGIAEVDGITVDMFYATTPEATSGTVLQVAPVSAAVAGTYSASINTSNNFVPAGSWLSIITNANSNQLHGAVTIRFRSRMK